MYHTFCFGNYEGVRRGAAGVPGDPNRQRVGLNDGQLKGRGPVARALEAGIELVAKRLLLWRRRIIGLRRQRILHGQWRRGIWIGTTRRRRIMIGTRSGGILGALWRGWLWMTMRGR